MCISDPIQFQTVSTCLHALSLQLRVYHCLAEHWSPNPSCKIEAPWMTRLVLVFFHISFCFSSPFPISTVYLCHEENELYDSPFSVIGCLLMGKKKKDACLVPGHAFFHCPLRSVGLLYGMKLNTSICFCFIPGACLVHVSPGSCQKHSVSGIPAPLGGRSIG